MQRKSPGFGKAVFAMVGTVIGAGVFALPAAFQEAGIVTGSISYWCTALIVVMTHVLYVECVLRTKQSASHRFPVQVRSLLGPWAERIAFLTHPAQIIGASLVYMILGGTFLSVLVQSFGAVVPLIVWQIFFWAMGAAIVYRGLSFVSFVESKTSSILVGALMITAGCFVPQANASLIDTSHWPALAGSFGIFLFALFGWEVIPEVAQLLRGNHVQTRAAVIVGSLGAALVMWLFGVLGYLALGNGIYADVDGLTSVLPPLWAWIFPLIGFLAVTSPYLTLTEDLETTLRTDAGLSKNIAWTVTFAIPLLLFFFISHDFLEVIGFMGGVFASINGILISCMALKMRVRVLPVICIVFFASVLIRQLYFFMR